LHHLQQKFLNNKIHTQKQQIIKGIQLAISTLVLLVLGVLVLIGLIFMLTGGFKNFQKTTQPLLEGTQAAAIKESCNIACASENKLTYCCEEFDFQGQILKCEDSKLEADCSLSCEGFSCG